MRKKSKRQTSKKSPGIARYPDRGKALLIGVMEGQCRARVLPLALGSGSNRGLEDEPFYLASAPDLG